MKARKTLINVLLVVVMITTLVLPSYSWTNASYLRGNDNIATPSDASMNTFKLSRAAYGTGTSYKFTVTNGSDFTVLCESSNNPAKAVVTSTTYNNYRIHCMNHPAASPFDWENSVWGKWTIISSETDVLANVFWKYYGKKGYPVNSDNLDDTTYNAMSSELTALRNSSAKRTAPLASKFTAKKGTKDINKQTYEAEKDGDVLKSDTFKFNSGHDDIATKITVPSGVSINYRHKGTDGTWGSWRHPTGTTRVLTGENEVYFTAASNSDFDASIAVVAVLSSDDTKKAYFIDNVYRIMRYNSWTLSGKEVQDLVMAHSKTVNYKFTVGFHEQDDGAIRLVKTILPEYYDYAVGEQYSLSGIEYKVYSVASENSTSTKNYVATFTINDSDVTDGEADGIITDIQNDYVDSGVTGLNKKTLKGLPEGIYMAKETKGNEHFSLNATPIYVTVQNGKTSVITGEDACSTQGYLMVKKTYVDAVAYCVKGNPNYAIDGAKYAIYRTKENAISDINRVEVLTINKGQAISKKLDCTTSGKTYYVKEIEASKGCDLDTKIYDVQVKPNITGQTINLPTVESKERPKLDPIHLLLTKEGDSGKKVENAHYQLKFYVDKMSTDPAIAGKTPAAVWEFKTDSDGEMYFYNDNRWFVNGGLVDGSATFYIAESGNPSLPEGTLTIQEISAPDEYMVDDTVFVFPITPGSTPNTTMYNSFVHTETEVRGDFDFTKYDEDGKPLANVKFKITAPDGESHIIWTDENGYYSSSSSYIPHSYNTNSDEAGSGIWFGLADVDDDRGALPYGEYELEELRCEANKNTYKDIEHIKFSIKTNEETYEIGEITNYKMPTISTTAVDDVTGTNVAALGETLNAKDIVACKRLEIGHNYTLSCKVWSKKDKKFLEVNGTEIIGTKDFVADKEEMEVTVPIKLTVDESFYGQDIVFFEYLYDDYYEGELIARHDSAESEKQTIHFPSIKTTAKDVVTGKKEAKIEKKSTIVDTVELNNFVSGHTFVAEALLMDKSTNLPVKDENGNTYTGTKQFKTTTDTKSVDVNIEFDSTIVEGKSVVVFEKIYYVNDKGEKILVSKHEDIDDYGQEVKYPKYETTVEDKSTKQRESLAGKKTTLIDHVAYTNITVGEEHTMVGKLVFQDTGKPVLDENGEQITASTTWTPKEPNGVVDVVFEFDSSLLAGKTTVVFEDCYWDDILVGSEAKIDNEAQTTRFPGVKTVARDSVSLTHKGKRAKNSKIIDAVHCTNIEAGATYKVEGKLVDAETGQTLKDDNGNDIAASKEFVAKTTDTSVNVVFMLDSLKLLGKSVVCYERLYKLIGDEYILVGIHENKDDKGQTVTYDNKEGSVEITPGDDIPDSDGSPHTSDVARPFVFVIIFLLAAISLVALVIIRRKVVALDEKD